MTSKEKQGLTEEQAREGLMKNGFNELEEGKKTSAVGIFFAQFQDVLTLTLLAATILSFFLGEISDAITICVILLINGILGFFQEYRTEKSLAALSMLSAPMATVVREGAEKQIPSREVTVGDVVLLEAGDRVCADCSMIEGSHVEVNESILTGESVTVPKDCGGDERLYMGSMLTVGRCRAVVTEIGMNTKMGQIAHMLKHAGNGETPLKKTLNRIGRELVVICFAVCVLRFAAVETGCQQGDGG